VQFTLGNQVTMSYRVVSSEVIQACSSTDPVLQNSCDTS